MSIWKGLKKTKKQVDTSLNIPLYMLLCIVVNIVKLHKKITYTNIMTRLLGTPFLDYRGRLGTM